MIRGTNKRIIEINGEDGSNFERIVLFLRPEQDEASQQKMLKMAEDYADGLFKSHTSVSMLSPRRINREKIKKILMVSGGALLAAGSAALLIVLL